MVVTVNGEERALVAGTTVRGLLTTLGAPGDGRGVAVAIGGEVVPRSAWDEVEVGAGARVEVLIAVQGG